ncbi:hypothetical protein QN345_16705 [Cryobacterium sp. 10I1]|uniref:hypothetical protein n=1 Tax=unclassified Cryobacterium TaxID=2649013 RepID=UPI002AB5C534|nr:MULTISPECIES: hypothetical protein [unclassified Cryobacterium]MDY7544531.1 hypothetical protein [Cryobacterium sp. 5B3]MEB0000878.1 hypothetical protein [Cryobacterium sp. RTS3]MEB0004789.1 hypothetical protein [Cryobacterium sp. RTC2.1]MEB0203645.1 hypothetical protein [Cryobacterium sp. 5I3]MEB0267862.1 hypothetical protein [Cryobacterium sp. 10I5]
MAAWTVEYEGDTLDRFVDSLPPYEQAVLIAAIEHVLEVYGIDICAGEWGKSLGDGLYEFRVRKSLQAIFTEAGLAPPMDMSGIDRQVLLRVFCTFHGCKIVLLYSGYNKKSGFNRWKQHLDHGGGLWDVRRVGWPRNSGENRCGRQAGRRGGTGSTARISGGLVGQGISSEEAGERACVSAPVGTRFFRHAGGMLDLSKAPLSG